MSGIEEMEETTADPMFWDNEQLDEIMARLQQRATYEYTPEPTLPVVDLVEEETRELTSRQKSRQMSRERHGPQHVVTVRERCSARVGKGPQ